MLRRSELIVKYDQVRRIRASKLGNLFRLACSDERSRIGRFEFLRRLRDGVSARSVGEAFKLGE